MCHILPCRIHALNAYYMHWRSPMNLRFICGVTSVAKYICKYSVVRCVFQRVPVNIQIIRYVGVHPPPDAIEMRNICKDWKKKNSGTILLFWTGENLYQKSTVIKYKVTQGGGGVRGIPVQRSCIFLIYRSLFSLQIISRSLFWEHSPFTVLSNNYSLFTVLR